jgi:hypothetical protein
LWFLKLKFFVFWWAWCVPFHALSYCLGIILGIPSLITCLNCVKQATVIIYRLNKFLTRFQP